MNKNYFIFGIVFLFMISLVSATDYYYDMGNGNIQSGYTQILQNTDYSDATGYGWESAGSVTTDFDRGSLPNALLEDWSTLLEADGGTYAEFKQNVTNGNYTVIIYTGDYTNPTCNVSVLLEGTNVGQTTAVFATNFSNFNTSVSVSDGILNVRLTKPSVCTITDKHVKINGIIILLNNETEPEPPTPIPYNLTIGSPTSTNTIQTTIPLTSTHDSTCRWSFLNESYSTMASNKRFICNDYLNVSYCMLNAISGVNDVYFACINDGNSSETKTGFLSFNSSYTTTGNIATRDYYCNLNGFNISDNFLMDLPAGYINKSVIMLHGRGISASSFKLGDASTFDTYFNDRYWATIYPDLDPANVYQNWYNLTSQNCFEDLVSYLNRQYDIDVLATYGLSMGGGGALSLASTHNNLVNRTGSALGISNYTLVYNQDTWTQSELIASFVGTPATATNTYNNFSANYQVLRLVNIPTILIHGDSDALINVEQSRQLNESLSLEGYYVQYYEVVGGTHDGGLIDSYKSQVFDFFNSSYEINTTINIINYTPSDLNFTIQENQSINFSLNVDTPVDYSIKWFLDGVLQATASSWQWVISLFDSGLHAILGLVDTHNQNINVTFIANVTNLNSAPKVLSISVPSSSNSPNIALNVTCNVYDDSNDTSLLTVEIEKRTSLLWESMVVNYLSDNSSYSTIPADLYNVGDTIDIRCRATDVDSIPLSSEWFTVNSIITYTELETAPEPPSTLLPQFGKYKLVIPVICSDSKDLESENQKLSYYLYKSINGSEYNYLANSSGFVIYSDNIYEDGYNTTYSYSCKGYDGILFSNYSYTGTIMKDNVPVFELVELNDERTIIANKPKSFTVYVDLSALSGYKVIYSFIDCNNDGIWDDYEQHDEDKIDETYSCVFPSGKSDFRYGIIVNKINTDSNWVGVCDSLNSDVENCEYSKTYPVIAR